MGGDKVRVGVVGVGYLGRLHAEKYARLKDAELVGVADLDRARAEQVAAEYRTRAFATVDELLAERVDALSVVVPTTGHHEVARRAMEWGADVLVEKPFTVSLKEADTLIDLAAEHDRVLQVGHLERFNPALVALADRIEDPMFIEAHRLAPFGERGTEVDVVLDLMIHDLDIVLWAVDSPVEEISAVGIPVLTDKLDIANVRLEFASGCVANLTASRVSLQKMRKVRLFQADAYFSLDFQSKKANVVRRETHPEHGPTIAGEEIDLEPGDALLDELSSFVRCVKDRATPVVTGADGRAALQVAVEIGQAIRARLKEHAGRLPDEVIDKVAP